MTKKEFALQAIAPYYKNPDICGYENGVCCYLTDDNRRCVFGKYMIDPSNYDQSATATDILNAFGEDILIKEARGILTANEWGSLQFIHDSLATNKGKLPCNIEELELFTVKELEKYCKNN